MNFRKVLGTSAPLFVVLPLMLIIVGVSSYQIAENRRHIKEQAQEEAATSKLKAEIDSLSSLLTKQRMYSEEVKRKYDSLSSLVANLKQNQSKKVRTVRYAAQIVNGEEEGVKLRSQPSTGNGSFEILRLKNGSKLTYLSRSSEKESKILTNETIQDYWYKVKFEGKTGWVFGYYIGFKPLN